MAWSLGKIAEDKCSIKESALSKGTKNENDKNLSHSGFGSGRGHIFFKEIENDQKKKSKNVSRHVIISTGDSIYGWGKNHLR